MKRLLVAFVVTVLGATGYGQVKGNISSTFREKAEDVVDCLDAANIVAAKSDAVFYPQSLQCRTMLRKLQRAASNPAERSVTDDLQNYQQEVVLCHAGGVSCAQESKDRSAAIKDGGLRAPDAPGK